MKLHYIEGCVHTGLDVDDKDFNDYTNEEKKEILHKVINNCDPDYLSNLLIHYIELVGDCKMDDEPCECCGDYTLEYNYTI